MHAARQYKHRRWFDAHRYIDHQRRYLDPVGYLAGQTGEHHDTQLKVVLPSGWKGQDTYLLWFRNAGGVYQTEA